MTPKYYIDKIILTKKGRNTTVKIKEDTAIYSIIIQNNLEDVLKALFKIKRDLWYDHWYTYKDFNF